MRVHRTIRRTIRDRDRSVDLAADVNVEVSVNTGRSRRPAPGEDVRVEQRNEEDQ